MVYEFHPFADIWPLLEGEDFIKLRDDIAAHGQIVSIQLYENKILDGRNRYRAIEALGIRPRFAETQPGNDQEALALVTSLNEHRRHMSVSQRAMAAGKLANLRHGANRFRQGMRVETEISVSTLMTTKKAAKAWGVSESSAQRARAIIDSGDKETVKAIEQGKTVVDREYKKLAAKRQQSKPPSKISQAIAQRNRVFERRAEIAAQSRRLTKEQVDPDFKGTPLEFTAKYGHVQIKTAAEQREDDEKIAVSQWIGAFRELAKAAEAFMNVSDIAPADFKAWADRSPKHRHPFVNRHLQMIAAACARVANHGEQSAPCPTSRALPQSNGHATAPDV